MQCFFVVYPEYPTHESIFICIHTCLKALVYTEKIKLLAGYFMVYH